MQTNQQTASMEPKSRRAYKNGPEEAFAAWAESRGWSVTKRGWPDFFCQQDGKIACVEVKPKPVKHGHDPLPKRQHTINQALAAAGIPCYRWSPATGLVPINGYGAASSQDESLATQGQIKAAHRRGMTMEQYLSEKKRRRLARETRRLNRERYSAIAPPPR